MSKQFAAMVSSLLREICPNEGINLSLHEPYFFGNESKYVQDCIDSTFVSSVGKYVEKFESALATYTGSRHVVAVVNGTSALHISLLLAGVRPGIEVLIPPLTFAATANAVMYCGADPHFVEIDEETLAVDPGKLRAYLIKNTTRSEDGVRNIKTGKIIKALVLVHVFGHAGKIEELADLCIEFNLTLVEDAAEGLGSYYKNKHVGTFSQLGILSFNGNKIITTGGGGAILCQSDDLAKKAKHITTTAKINHPWEYKHDMVGYNYRLPNLNAALGLAQLENIEKLVALKRGLFARYKEIFVNIDGVDLVQEPLNSRSNYWLQAIKLTGKTAKFRDEILSITNSNGVMTRPCWTLLNEMDHFAGFNSMETPVSKAISERLINIPSSAQLLV